MKLTETITPLSSLNTNVTSEQESILGRALSVYPEDRYPSILAFADALLATLTLPVHTTPLPILTAQAEAVPAFDKIPHTEPLATEDDLEHQPQPEPLPQPVPEPLPAPAPEPLPVPAPEPLPQPAPDPLPAPDPEPLPQPAPETLPQPDPQPGPDVFQPLPLPQTDPGPTLPPQTDPPVTLQSSEHQELVEEPIAQPTISPRLIISYPDVEEPTEFMLAKNEIMLGRASSDDVLLNHDTSTSRHHASLKHEDGHYVIYDQRSTNGVFVNGRKLIRDVGYMLEDGDHISIGNYELIFRFNLSRSSHVHENVSNVYV